MPIDRTYNWGSYPITPLDHFNFVPMAWGPGSAAGFAADSTNFNAYGVTHLLSFNEPDVSLYSLGTYDGLLIVRYSNSSPLAALVSVHQKPPPLIKAYSIRPCLPNTRSAHPQ